MVSFFGVLLTLYYDYMCSETDFIQFNFHATTAEVEFVHPVSAGGSVKFLPAV